jgi:hypothetical protein
MSAERGGARGSFGAVARPPVAGVLRLLLAVVVGGVLVAGCGGRGSGSPYDQGWSWGKAHMDRAGDPQACVIEKNRRFGTALDGVDFYAGCQNALDGLKYDPSGKEVYTPTPSNSGFGLDPS